MGCACSGVKPAVEPNPGPPTAEGASSKVNDSPVAEPVGVKPPDQKLPQVPTPAKSQSPALPAQPSGEPPSSADPTTNGSTRRDEDQAGADVSIDAPRVSLGSKGNWPAVSSPPPFVRKSSRDVPVASGSSSEQDAHTPSIEGQEPAQQDPPSNLGKDSQHLADEVGSHQLQSAPVTVAPAVQSEQPAVLEPKSPAPPADRLSYQKANSSTLPKVQIASLPTKDGVAFWREKEKEKEKEKGKEKEKEENITQTQTYPALSATRNDIPSAITFVPVPSTPVITAVAESDLVPDPKLPSITCTPLPPVSENEFDILCRPCDQKPQITSVRCAPIPEEDASDAAGVRPSNDQVTFVPKPDKGSKKVGGKQAKKEVPIKESKEAAPVKIPEMPKCPVETQRAISANPIDPGKLTDFYEVGNKLGEGTFGVVRFCWRRCDPHKKNLAVKYIDKAVQDQDTITKETSIMRTCNHVNVVRCIAVFDEPFFTCIVMDHWGGRDVVTQLIEYIENGKELSEDCVANLVLQMLRPLAYLHQEGIIHRDVKMDNYLLDIPEINDLNAQVALSDFGCATRLILGKRMTESVGTKVYKAPEFIMEDYAHKVDVWAVGVSAYALLAGTLPFETERGILHLRPSYPEGLSANCLGLMKALLMKNENRRLSAREAIEHNFFSEKASGEIAIHKCGSNLTFNKSLLEQSRRDFDSDTAERRELLMVRIQSHNKAPATGKPIDGNDFEVTNNKDKDRRKYAWWDQEKALPLLNTKVGNGIGGIPPKALQTLAGVKDDFDDSRSLFEVAWTPQVVESLLIRHKVDIDLYGINGSKSVDQLANEVRRGEAMLMQDVTNFKKLVRLIDQVSLQLELKLAFPSETWNSKFNKRWTLVMSSRRGDKPIIPTARRTPHDTTRQSVARIIATLRHHLVGAEIAIADTPAERLESERIEQEYPGLATIERTHLFHGEVVVHDTAALSKMGFQLSGPGRSEGQVFVVDGCECQWVSDQRCAASNIRLVQRGGKDTSPNLPALVRLPLNYSEAVVRRLLWSYGQSGEKFGEEGNKYIEKLAIELTKGEATLCERKGKIVKVVSLVMVYIEDVSTNRALVEIEHISGDTVFLSKCLPQVRVRPQEDLQDAIGRIITNRLQLPFNAVQYSEAQADVIEEECIEASPFGLLTIYRKHVVKSQVTSIQMPEDGSKRRQSPKQPKQKAKKGARKSQ